MSVVSAETLTLYQCSCTHSESFNRTVWVQTMKLLLLAATIMSAASATNAQDSVGPSDLGLSPDAIRSIQVRLADNATEACWTNLQEVREYAEEKLRIANYNVVNNLELARVPDFWFWIGVGARRDPLDACDGLISVSVQSMAPVEAFYGRFVLVPEVTVNISNAVENLNRRVLEAVQEMTDQM